MHFQVELFLRYGRVVGGNVVAHQDIPWSTDVKYEDALEAAHQNVDGSRPTVDQCGNDINLWYHALKIRDAEDELRELHPDPVKE